jgi:hypothetical protein
MIVLAELKTALVEALEKSKRGDWLYDGNDEYYEETFDEELAASNVIQLLFDKGILKRDENIKEMTKSS